jgi:glycosyltransferase involved in cell wall biosynthesis
MESARKRVLFVVPALGRGGAERVFTTLLRNLDRSRFELHLGVLEAEGSYLKDLPDDVALHILNVTRVRYALPSLLRLIRKIKPQTVLSTPGHLNLFLILAKPLMPRDTRLIVREDVASAAYSAAEKCPRLWQWLFKSLYKRADMVICLSDSLADDMHKCFRVPRDKLVRIYNPVDIERIRELGGKAPNPFVHAGPRLVAAGRLNRQKGFDLILDVLPSVLKSHPDAHLTILGEGPLLHDLSVQAQRLGVNDRVAFVGFQENPWAYFKHGDVFVFPSRFEGMPNALLEALALGMQAVATNCPGGIAEIRTFDDQLLLIPVEDRVALRTAIIAACSRVKSDPESLEEIEKRMKAFNLRTVVEEYSKHL